MRVNVKSIRFRLIAWYIFSLGLVHLVVGTGLYRMISARLHHEFDQRLNTYTTCLVEVLPQHKQLNLPQVVAEMTEVSGLEPDAYVHIVDQHGQLIYQSPGVPEGIATSLLVATPLPQDRPVTLKPDGSRCWRAIRRAVYDDGGLAYVGLVAVPMRGIHEALAHVRFVLIVIVPCVLLLASFGAWVLLNRTLRPLQEVIRMAHAIQAKDFAQQLRVPKTGDEVQTLAETFNEMIARLQRSFAQMRRFISDASHELRTPLAVLRGEVELELRNHPLSDRCQKTLETCASEISRMSQLVERLLFLSNADAEKIALELRPVCLSRTVEEMAEEARILAEAKGLHVEVVSGSDAVVHADDMRLKQLLLNLIDNAVKYTPPGGQITLAARAANGHAELMVTDTGIGIEAQDLPRIFDRFYRADSARSRADGSYGLGLAICKWIAEAHGGTIHVESSPGQGSTFSVRLPAA